MSKKPHTTQSTHTAALIVTGTIEKAVVNNKGVDVTFKGLHLTGDQIATLSHWIDQEDGALLTIALTPVQSELMYPNEPAKED